MEITGRSITWLILLALFWPENTLAVVSFRAKRPVAEYVETLDQLKPSLRLPLVARVHQLKPSHKHILTRIRQSKKDRRVEPFKIFLKDDLSYLMKLSVHLAKTPKIHPFFRFLRDNIKEEEVGGSLRKYAELSEEAYGWLRVDRLQEKFSREHLELILKASDLESRATTEELLSQLRGYMLSAQWGKLVKALQEGEPLSVEDYLLPAFARKMVGKFSIYRGPNCFHAALAFQGKRFVKARKANVKREIDHHAAMINYDELWRVLNALFYEVDPGKSPLKFGDILVFYERPQGHLSIPHYKNIKHATSYLFDDFTFSKGSKSPNSPYSIKTLESEWKTWSRIVKNMGAKVYRRKLSRPDRQSYARYHDWLY